MNYTEKYHLPQWEENDRVMRTDFNQMCADMETGLEGNAQAAQTAQTTADIALSTAQTALAHKNYASGTYTGTGYYQTIEVGFKPSAVIICCLISGGGELPDSTTCFIFVRDGGNVDFLDNGFRVFNLTANERPTVNVLRYTYSYIAFR